MCISDKERRIYVVKKIIAAVVAVVIIAAVVVFVLRGQQETARSESTYKIGTVTRADIDDKVSTTGTLKAQNSYSQLIETGLIIEVYHKLGDVVNVDDEICEIQVTNAVTGVTNQKVLAEAEGTITEMNIAEGQTFNGMTAAFVIENLNSQKVEVKLSKNDSYKITEGLSAVVEVNDEEYTGTVDTVSPTATQFTTAQGVESSLIIDVKLDNPINDVKVGFDVDCEILLEQLTDVLVVPLQAVVTNDDATTHIFVVQDDKARDKEVKLGLVSGSEIQILEGVSEGDKIILNPKTTLKDGDKVIKESSDD